MRFAYDDHVAVIIFGEITAAWSTQLANLHTKKDVIFSGTESQPPSTSARDLSLPSA
jgi:hypothetical protein